MRLSSALTPGRILPILCALLWTFVRANVTTVQKCCDDGYIFNKGRCIFDPRPFQLPQLYTWPDVEPVNDTEIRIEYGFPRCETYTYYLDPFEDPSEEFNLLETGWLLRGDGRRDPPGQFCLETIASEKAVRPVSCFPGDEEPEDDEARGMFAVYPMGMIVSVPFLVITLIVYGSVKELHSLHGWCLMSHVTALIFSYSTLTIVQVTSTSLNYLTCTLFDSLRPGYENIASDNHLNCTKYRLSDDDDHWTLTPEGLDVEGYSSLRQDYCLERFDAYNAIYPVLCHKPPSIAAIDDTPFLTYGSTYLVSFFFIFVTFVVYVSVFNLKSVQRFCNVNYFASLSLAMVSVSIVQLFPAYLSDLVCQILGFAVQFFFLATFFWLNVMCIDICWAFSGFKLLRGSASERDRKKLLFYSLYAWGMPLLILTITVGVDYSDAVPATSLFKPGIGTDKCFFKGRVATWVFFYGPMGVVILCNSVLYTVTALRLCRHRRATAVLKRGDSRKHDGNDKERFNLYLKLFLVMGINWVSELVSYMFGNEVPKYMWYATDVTNTLQGLFIFLIFVWKKRVRRLVWNKLCKSRAQNNGGPRGSIQTTHTSSTSSGNSNSIKLKQVNISVIPAQTQ